MSRYGIKTSCIMAGLVNTSMSNSYYKYKQHAIQPSDIGQVCHNIINTPHTCVPSEMVLDPQYDANTESEIFKIVDAKLSKL